MSEFGPTKPSTHGIYVCLNKGDLGVKFTWEDSIFRQHGILYFVPYRLSGLEKTIDGAVGS